MIKEYVVLGRCFLSDNTSGLSWRLIIPVVAVVDVVVIGSWLYLVSWSETKLRHRDIVDRRQTEDRRRIECVEIEREYPRR